MEDASRAEKGALFHVKQRAFMLGILRLLLPRVGFGVGKRFQNGVSERGNGFDVALL